jgi:hypothetical protein
MTITSTTVEVIARFMGVDERLPTAVTRNI